MDYELVVPSARKCGETCGLYCSVTAAKSAAVTFCLKDYDVFQRDDDGVRVQYLEKVRDHASLPTNPPYKKF